MIHGLIFFAFKLAKAPPVAIKPVEIELREITNPHSTDQDKTLAQKQRIKRGKTDRSNLALGDLKPKDYTLERGYHATNGGRDFGHTEDTSGWSENDWGRKATDLKQIEHYLTYERIFQHLQGMINYPPGLGRRKVSGTVTARLAFTQPANCNETRSFVRGGHPYLRVYIASMLKKYCRILQESDVKVGPEKTVDLTFAFVLTAEAELLIEQTSHDGITGNVMRFYRSYPAPTLEYRLGPIRGVFGVPMVFLDQEWIFEKWDLWVNEIDVLDRYREQGSTTKAKTH